MFVELIIIYVFNVDFIQDILPQNPVFKIICAVKSKRSPSVVSKIKNVDSLSAFEASRKEARVCRQEFEQVKKRRHDLFSRCFEHVSVSIDQIYKKLCRNNSAQVCISRPRVLLGTLCYWWGFFPVGNK